jgi:hypothetical protein
VTVTVDGLAASPTLEVDDQPLWSSAPPYAFSVEVEATFSE